MRNKLTVLIPDGEDGNIPLTVLRCLGQVPDIRASVLSGERWAPIRFSRHRHDYFIHNINTHDRKRVDAILQAARQAKADIILPVEEATIRLMAEHLDEMKSIAALPPIPTPELMDTVPDKWLLAQLLEKENIPHPSTIFFQGRQTCTSEPLGMTGFTNNQPPRLAKRSLIPTRPSPILPASAGMPCPLSCTDTLISSFWYSRVTRTLLARACFATLVSVSCTKRYKLMLTSSSKSSNSTPMYSTSMPVCSENSRHNSLMPKLTPIRSSMGGRRLYASIRSRLTASSVRVRAFSMRRRRPPWLV